MIVVWLIGASLGLPILLRGVQLPDDHADEEHLRVRGVLAEAAIAELEQQPWSVAADRILELHRARLLDPSENGDRPQLERELRLIGIAAERRALRDMLAARVIPEELGPPHHPRARPRRRSAVASATLVRPAVFHRRHLP